MTKFHLIYLFAAGALCALPAHGQQVLSTYNPLAAASIEIEGNSATYTAPLTDGNDLTVVTLNDLSAATILMTLDEPFIAKGLNIVAGSDVNMTPSRMTLYARNSDEDAWKSIGLFHVGSFEAPYTAYTAKTSVSTTPYTRFKLEITKLKSGNTLQIAELQLLGTPAADGAVSTAENGTFTASSNLNDPTTSPMVFRGAKAENGLDNTWIQYSFNEPTAISAYSVTTASNTSSNTRPRAWELLGSDDGENWTTLDMRANQGNYAVDNYISMHQPGHAATAIDFAAVADQIHEVIARDFYRDYFGGKFLVNSWNPDPEKINWGYNYWWMAHAIDAYVDAFARTGNTTYRIRAQQIRQGMYVAYDGSRLDLWNSFYDDMEWMNLACIRAYENFTLGKAKWLEEAEQLFGWIWGGWNYDNGSEGGIRWNSGDGTGKNSCSNAPAMIGAARLYQITGQQHYLDKAKMIFDWMLTHSRFDDGFIKDAPDNDNRGWTFSYNQGTWVGGLLELYRITKEQKYYDIAVDLMDKSLDGRWYSPDGIMREQGGGDGGLFKGIYIRYITNWILSGFLDPERQRRYTMYMAENGRSLYECALRKPDWKIMPDWKNRSDWSNGEPNGSLDGNYDASILLSGLFLCESMDMMRRAGLLNDDYSVKNAAMEQPYRHYRLKFTSNYGSNDLQIAGFNLYADNSQSFLDKVVTDKDIEIIAQGHSLMAKGASFLEVYTPDGCLISRSDASLPIHLPAGFYIVAARGNNACKTLKIKL